MNEVLVTSYVNPDIDGVACMLGYCEFLNKSGKSAVAKILGNPHDEAQYVLTRFNIPSPEIIPDTEKFNKIILVDTSQLSDLNDLINISNVIEIVDHRQLNDAHEFVNANIQIELVGAAATLIAEKFMEKNTPISKNSAILLYAAIISNTLNFQASVTTNRDHEAAKWLQQVANLPENFPHELFLAKSDLSGDTLERRMVEDFSTIEFQGKKRGIAQIEIVGTRDLVKNREAEILAILQQLMKDKSLDYNFLSLVDLDEGMNIFVTDHRPSQELIEKTFNIKFENHKTELKPFLMRKQIGPLINKMLENS